MGFACSIMCQGIAAVVIIIFGGRIKCYCNIVSTSSDVYHCRANIKPDKSRRRIDCTVWIIIIEESKKKCS
jgi:hypothetical protein